MKRIFKYLTLIVALAMALAACAASGETQAAPELSAYFTDRDLSGAWDARAAVAIALNGDSAACDAAGVTVDGGTITIAAEGVYVLSGTLEDGSVVVSADDAAKVQLVLNGVNITSANSAAILVENADKVFVTLAGGTENALSNGGTFDGAADVDAAVFARDDLVFNGTGALAVASPAGNGIVGKDDLKFASGSYAIAAAGRGIDANDSVRVAGGSFSIASEKDAVRAKHDTDADKGYVIVFGGEFDITVGGGADNGATHAEGMMGFGSQAASAGEGDSVSAKGIKASGDLTLCGGSFNIDAADDALHAGGDLTVLDGSLTLASGDDGMHADAALTLAGGSVNIARSYEGVEGQTIAVSGGDIRVNAADDGLNAAGGNDASGYGFYDMFASQAGVEISISGGTLVVNAAGDGIDSNGDLFVTGGAVLVSGPTNSGNGALDYNGTGSVTGGTFIAAGAAGMAVNFGGESTQAAALVNLNGQAGEIAVSDAQGNVILAGAVEKAFDCLVISCPEMAVGESYTVSANGASTEVTLTDTITGGDMGGFPQGGMGRRGGFGGQGGMPGNPGGMPGNPGGQRQGNS